MKFLKILALSVALFTTVQAMQQPSSHTKGTPTGKPTGQLKPGEYWWKPQLSPSGPLMVLVSVPEQTMHVYRNGILIGRSTVSTGSKGHSTPGGVFSILGKHREYYSKKYDNAPMPNMQRLTDTGICMHSGNLPGYPASHGCIRMPFDFSQLLFSATAQGGTVVVGDGKVPVPHLAANPGLLLAPKDLSSAMTRPLASNDYDWKPERSASGPITMVVSSADKAIYVYRNGILIGRTSVSTGSQGHSTPGGVFSILGKSKEYYSKKYNNAPMPNMQRLTDTGICMHSGNLPGYPASHGCIRMPFDFSQLLFSVTSSGGTVVVGDGKVPVPHLASSPGLLLAPKDISAAMVRPLASNEYDWKPERSPSGPITMVVSAADKAIYVYRNGNVIGRAPVEVSGRGSLGNHVYSLLEGTTDRQSSLAPGRAARKWMTVTSSGRSVPADKIASRLRVNPEFAAKVYDTLTPGTTVIITDQPVVRSRGKAAVLEG